MNKKRNRTKYMKEYYAINKNKKLAYMRVWNQEHREERIAYLREYRRTTAGKEAQIRGEIKRQSTVIGRLKCRARYATRHAIRDGILKRQPCEKCGASAQVHHDDYSHPMIVRWLCPTHHRDFHRRPK